jgi:hypothetical protein
VDVLDPGSSIADEIPDPKQVGPTVEAHPARRDRPWLPVALFVVALDTAIFAPLFGSGTLLLLDYVDYPIGANAHLGANAWGFAPGLTSRSPIDALLLGLFRLAPWSAVKLLPLLLLAPLAAWGFYRLLRRRPLSTIGATLLFVVNPFVYERVLGGQIYFVAGYALLPLLLSLLLADSGGLRAAIGAGILVSLQIALSPHFVFIGGMLLVAATVSALRRRERHRTLRNAGITALVAVGTSVYWIAPIATRGADLGRVTATDLQTFATRPDPAVGLGANVAGLYGFWRASWPLSKSGLPAWPLLLLAVLAVAAMGFVAARRGSQRRLATVSILVGISAVLLACGAQGPTGALFRIAFDHVPGFRIMREPEKFEALLALAYAVLFGWGVERIVKASSTKRGRALVAAVILATPCVYTFRMFWGFAGYVHPSTIPSSWNEADALMSGPGKVLALPGSQYLPFEWTQERSVANPLPSFFDRDVLIDGRLDLGSLQSQISDARSRYLAFITDHGSRTTRFGNLVAPLGVKYVLLAKTTNWQRFAWLANQTDLKLVRAWPDLELFQNTEPVASAYAPTRSVSVNDWGEAMGLAERARLTALDVTVIHPGPGPIRDPNLEGPLNAASWHPLPVTDVTPVSEQAHPNGGSIVLTRPFDPAWEMNGSGGTADLGILQSFRVTPRTGTADVRFTNWPLVRTSYLLGAIALAISLICMALSRRSERP